MSIAFRRSGTWRVARFLFVLVCVSPAGMAAAQTGGSTGATGLTASDFFISARKTVDGANLNERDRANYLNQASCLCKKEVSVRAVLQPTAAVRAASVPSTATVAIFLGNDCDQATLNPYCLNLLGEGNTQTFSDFRLKGLTVKTSVDVLARPYSVSSPKNNGVAGVAYCGRTGISTGTGGADGTGGAGTGGAGTGGAGGTGGGGTGGIGDGTGGTTGTGGSSSSGTTSGSPTQTIWVLVSNTGSSGSDIARVPVQWVIDTTPPDAPTNFKTEPANQALLASWTAVSATSNTDLLGYQILCSRGREDEAGLPVFTSKFTAAFDDRSCGLSTGTAFSRVDPVYVCSDLLSSVAVNYRLKILENDITYGVGIVSVDSHRNASVAVPFYKAPEKTINFYDSYRAGDPQGQAIGGFCSVESTPMGRGSVLAVVLFAGSSVGVVLRRRRRRSARRSR